MLFHKFILNIFLNINYGKTCTFENKFKKKIKKLHNVIENNFPLDILINYNCFNCFYRIRLQQLFFHYYYLISKFEGASTSYKP